MRKHIRIIISLVCVIIFTGNISLAQGLFQPVAQENISYGEKSITPPQQYFAYTVKEKNLSLAIEEAIENGNSIEIPLADGNSGHFKVKPYSVAAMGFYAKYPSIQTFQLTQIDGELRGYGDITMHGFHAVLYGKNGLTYIDPTHRDPSKRAYAVYYTKDYSRGEGIPPFECLTDEDFIDHEAPGEQIEGPEVDLRSANSDSVPLRTYRLVAATTGEYSSYHGGTKESVASALATLLVRVNEIMQREWSIRYELIEESDTLFFLDPDNDGFTNGNTSNLINEAATIIPFAVSQSLYDIGHVFCTNAGGLATVASVCQSSKVRGVSCSFNPVGDNYYVDIVCHEMGHQMGSRHSFNYCRGENESLGKGYEPGSGVTIMAYAGLCGSRNTQTFTDPYYNIGSIESIIGYMHDGGGNNCAEITPRNNTKPIITLPYEDDFSIPVSTPFELHASATDSEHENLLYCWEQHDAGQVNCEPGEPEGNCPLFRSFPPTQDSFRIFPKLTDILTGNSSRWEVLPTYSRDLSFACTVRDWDADGGALAWDFVNFEATESAGPFVVNSINGEYQVGDQIEISWDVANTDQAPVNCEFVDIYLSNNGGSSFPHLIAEDVPNIGGIKLNLPNIQSTNSKVKVKAANNIFFNISGSNFRIRQPTEPGFIGEIFPYAQQVCLPSFANIQISTEPFLDFDEMISVIDIKGLPPTAQYDVSPQMISPGENINLTIDFGLAAEDTYQIEVILRGGTDTVLVETQATVVSNDFSGLVPTHPVNNAGNVSQLTVFKWDAVEDANSYYVQVADNPSFEASTLVYESSETSLDSHSVEILLPKNELLYWRVVPINECGEGLPSSIQVFHTEAQTCELIQSDDVPKNIGTSGNVEVLSEVTFTNSGPISDVNVINLNGDHTYIGELIAHIISPEGTEVKLFDTDCFNFQGFNLSLDDQAPTGITCPLNAGRTNRPRGKLADFNGENRQGEWTLRLNDNTPGSGGRLQGWGLEICGSVISSRPSFRSDTVYLKETGGEQFITPINLLAEKDNIPDYQMQYTVVEAPEYGSIEYGSGPLQSGSTFNQDAVNNYWLVYEHDGSENELDFMSFTISDQEGGWIGLDTLHFKVDSTTSTSVVPEIDFQVFPNPATEQFTINIPFDYTQGSMHLINMHGTILMDQKLHGKLQYQIDCAHLPKGIYLIKIESDEGRGTRRIVIQ